MDDIMGLWPEWQVESVLGQGSFGKVYKIKREDVGGTFYSALKEIRIPKDKSEMEAVMTEGMDQTSTTAYFRSIMEEIVKEFAIMERFKGNSNIVSYEDHKVVPHEDGCGWTILIRMELLTPVTDYLTAHPLTESMIVKLGSDMCHALEICEQCNVIHRDIKPENIFVSERGDFKLGDFGVARTAEKTTANMSKKGTYTYMAPEVYKGETYNSTVDIYSLGIVLYRFLNDNRSPFLPPASQPITFHDREEAVIKRIAGTPLPPPAHGNDALRAVINKACAYRPEDRYQTADDMRRALENAIDFEPTVAEKAPSSPIKRLDKASVTPSDTGQQADTKKKRKKWPIVIASFFAAILGGFVLLVALAVFQNSRDIVIETYEVPVPASVTSVIRPDLDAEAYTDPGINIVPTKMLITRSQDAEGNWSVESITPVEGYEADAHDNSLYYPQWFWGEWELLGSLDGTEDYLEKSITLVDDGVGYNAISVFPGKFHLYPAWDPYNGVFDLTGDTSADMMDDYGVTTYMGEGKFTTAASSYSSYYPIFYDTNGNVLTLGVAVSYEDENGEEVSTPSYSDLSSYQANITPINFQISWCGYYLALTYEDQAVVYMPSDTMMSLEFGSDPAPDAVFWALSSDDMAGDLAALDDAFVCFYPYYNDRVNTIETYSFGEDGVFTLETTDYKSLSNVVIVAASCQYEYLLSDDNVILVDEDGTPAMYFSDSSGWSEETLESNLNWREKIGWVTDEP